ncbi:hypothetical protein BCR34DRAFT_579069 [Clohesyomyces aquaticus]|uniref:Rhodopsin domain-containing protein n=1 Tax=Clohesyomyces aquaticus TaxID=1231657 RepID=A0A1Y1YCX7_9PLEO|nr:hypothetical protein BCR34DRAFT_579069 [Clohesyomyces aquaticus]
MGTLAETTSPATIQAVLIFLTALDVIAVGLRLFTKHHLGQRIKADDWFATGALGFVIVLLVYLSVGIGKHFVGYPLSPDFTGEVYDPIVSGHLQLFYVWCLLLFPALWLIKCSFILFYRRVFTVDSRDYRDWTNILLILSLVFITIWTLAFGFAWAFACTPVRGFWSWPYAADEGPCVDTWKLHRAITISDFLVDFLIIIIPVPMIWRLHLPVGRKVAVLTVFFLGAIAVAASIMRMARVLWASESEANVDGLLVNSSVLFWAMIEVNLGLLAACLPTLRGFLKIRAVDSFIKTHRSKWSLRSSRQLSNSGDAGGLPYANSPALSRDGRQNERKKPWYPEEVTLTTMGSVVTRN